MQILYRLRLGVLRLLNILPLLFLKVFGITFSLPIWMKWIGTKLRYLFLHQRKKLLFTALGIVTLVVGGDRGYRYYQSRPKPEYVKVEISELKPTEFYEGARPNDLRLKFSSSAAPLEAVGKPIESGIKLTPNIKGLWSWYNDAELVFMPAEDWPVDKELTIQFQKGALSKNALLENDTLKTNTPRFEIKSLQPEFYQDPKDPLTKRALLTLKFSHAVDIEDLNKKVFVEYGDSSKGILGVGKKSFPFRLLPNKTFNEVVVQTDPLSIPDEEKQLYFRIEKGLRAKRGGETYSGEESNLKIPGMYSYFQVNKSSPGFAENQTFEMEQVLQLEFSTDVSSTEIAKNLKVYLLPERNPNQAEEDGVYPWDNSNVDENILNKSTLLKVEVLPTQYDSASFLSVKFQAPPERFIYIGIAKGAKSFGGYVLAKEYSNVEKIPVFPKRVSIMTKGSLLSLAGEKKISIAVRDISDLRLKFSRVQPQALNHFVTQTSDDFQNRRFQYNFNEENLSEIFSENRSFDPNQHGKTQYSSVDFNKYLKAGKNGLFVFEAREWFAKQQSEGNERDRRIILVTNLGLLIKKAQDGSFHVFVQNTHTGSPVSGATIEILGKNGIPIFSKVSDSNGHVVTPVLKDFKYEKAPIAVVAKTTNDYSFIPFDQYDRALNFSRFDIGGIDAGVDPRRIESFVFSDRGIYRPGDDIHFGVITKPNVWKNSIAGAPLMFLVQDSRGNEVYRKNFTVSDSGFESFDYKTEDNSPTGTYDAQIHTVKEKNKPDALIGSTTIRVEEFLPDRLRITSQFSSAVSEGWLKPNDLKGHVSLMNLFGSPAQNRRVKASVGLKPAPAFFKKYQEFQFFDPLKTEQSFSQELPETQTDTSGNADFNLPLESFGKGIFQLTFVAEGFEADSGRGVVTMAKTIVSPLDYLIGIKPDGNLNYIGHKDKRSLQLIAVDPTLAQIETKDLTLEVVEEKYVSILMKQSNGIYRYESVLKQVVKKSEKHALPKDGLNYILPTTDVGNFSLVIRDSQGTVLNKISYSVVGPGNISMSVEKNAELQIKLPKNDFKAGDMAELQIVAPYTGAGVITIERENIFQIAWFKTNSTSSVQKIRIPENLEGNAYITVNFLRAINSKEIFMSPLSYAVAPITISRKVRTNLIHIDIPEKIEPGQSIPLSYRSDSPSDIVLYGVDEGILQVAKYKTPAPLDFFFRKRALTTQTWQILDLLITEFSLQKSLSAPGGSEDAMLGKNLNPFKRKSLKPVTFWSGILQSGPTPQTYTYDVPDYFNGSLKVMAVSVSKDKIGVFEKSNIVKGPFVLSPNVPTFVAPGDTFKVSLGVSNQLQNKDEADIKIDLIPSKHFSVVGAKSQTLKIKSGNESSAVFEVKALSDLGAGELKFTGEGQGKTAKSTAFLSIRPAAPYRVTTLSGYTTSSKKDLDLERKIYPEFGSNQLMVGSVPLAFTAGLASYLEHYQHLCTEQLVSRGWTLFGLRQIPELQRDPQKTEEHIQRALNALSARQNSGGAFGFWSANSYYSNFQNIYAAHFLTDLAESGYPISETVRDRSLRFIREVVAMPDESISSLRDVSYGLYVLARNNIIHRDLTQNTLKRLQTTYPKQWKKDLSLAYLAATFALMKNTSEAEKLADHIDFIANVEPNYSDFYDSLRRNAQVLYLFTKHFPSRVKNLDKDVLKELGGSVEKGSYNTLTAAYTTLALVEYAKTISSGSDLKASLIAFDDKGAQSNLTLQNKIFPKAEIPVATKKVQLKNENEFPVFYQLVQNGFDTTTPQKALSKGLEILREFMDQDGHPLKSFKVGDKVDIHLRIRTNQENGYDNVAIVDLLPGGFEVELNPIQRQEQRPETPPNESSGESEDEDGAATEKPQPAVNGRSPGVVDSPIVQALTTNRSTWKPNYADIREDRVIIYGNVNSGASEFVYRARATAEGTFVVPPVFAESMYDRNVQALSKGDSVTVAKP